MSQEPIRRRDYDDDDPKPQKAGINPLLIGVGAVIVSLIAVYMLFSPVSQKTIDAKLTDATTNVTKVSTDLSAKFNTLQTDITSANTKQINAALANIPTVQSVTTAQNAATSAQATATQAQTAATQALNTANSIKIPVDDSVIVKQTASDVATLKQQVTDLTAKVNAAPTDVSGNSGTTTTDKLVVTVTDMYNLQIQAGDFDFTDSQDAIKLKITNNNVVDVADLTLYVYLVASDNISPSIIASKSMTGGISCTSITGEDYSEFKFRTGRISVQAGKTKTYYLTPSIQIKPYYAYRDIGGNETITATYTDNSTGTPIIRNNIANTTPTISKLNNDIYFDLTYDVIDYNLN